MTLTSLRLRRQFLTLLCLAAWSTFGISACASDQPTNAPRNQGPNSTNADPGPNSSAADPGPNPTDGDIKTVSGALTVVDGNCVRLVLDDNRDTLMLRFRDNYSVDERGLSRDGKLIAAVKSRLFVTGKRTTTDGQCGIVFNVESLNSAQNP